jgi:hypothetical protein
MPFPPRPCLRPRGRPLVAAVAAMLLAACARATPVAAPAPLPPPAAGDTALAARPRPQPVAESEGFARAVGRGTRTRAGTPGPRYWTQYARYRITADFDPRTSRLRGSETVWYLNRSPDTLPVLFVHLYQNLFAPNAARNELVPITAGTELVRVAAQGRVLRDSAEAPGYQVDGTRLRLALPTPLAPGDSARLELEWAFTLPPEGAPREGNTGEMAFVAYWYPQLAVYDDVNGWQIDPYMANAEFYMGYADYDVSLTVPAGALIGATGELVNADEVLSAQTRQRLAEARRGGEVVHVVADADRGAGRATAAGRDGRLTWRYRATNMRDFAFGVSDQYLWDATIAVVPRESGRADTAMIHAFYRPSTREWAWDQSARYGRHSVEFLSRYLWPYPYPQMTTADGPVSCSGMEYPMITCIGGRRDTLSLYSVTVHEIGHMWFPMEVGSDEKRFAWQDEGLTRFNQNQAMREFFNGLDRERVAREGYLGLARAGGEVELMRHGDEYPRGTPAYGIASYEKMATNMVALRALLGEATFLRAYRAYGLAWLKKHPTPFDFFNAFEREAGRDLDWFWRSWWYETWTLDQAIAGVRAEGGRLLVTVEDRGQAPMPARLAVRRSGGRVDRVEVPVDVWLAGARRHVVTVSDAGSVESIEIDPENAFPDIDRTNQRWTR